MDFCWVICCKVNLYGNGSGKSTVLFSGKDSDPI